jgi:hypothetical protein
MTWDHSGPLIRMGLLRHSQPLWSITTVDILGSRLAGTRVSKCCIPLLLQFFVKQRVELMPEHKIRLFLKLFTNVNVGSEAIGHYVLAVTSKSCVDRQTRFRRVPHSFGCRIDRSIFRTKVKADTPCIAYMSSSVMVVGLILLLKRFKKLSSIACSLLTLILHTPN